MLAQLSSQLKAHYLWKDHGDGFTKHYSFGLNTSYTPTYYSESIDHGCVGVGSHDGIRVQHPVAIKDDSCKVLKVDLMDNTTTRGDNLEIVKGFGAPL